MKITKVIYFVSTGLLSVTMLVGAYFELTQGKPAVDLLTHLGFPLYFNYLLGTGKLLGVLGIWQKKVGFLREWAYAGFVIDLAGALAAHTLVGDDLSAKIPALINAVLVVVSYFTFRRLKVAEPGFGDMPV